MDKKISDITGLGDQIIFNRIVGHNIKLYPKYYFNCWSAHDEYLRTCFNKKESFNEIYRYTTLNENLAYTIIHFASFPSIKPWNALKSIDNDGAMEMVEFANEFQKKNILLWWEYAKLIPAKNLAELVAFSMSRNFDKEKIFIENQTFIKNFDLLLKAKLSFHIPLSFDKNAYKWGQYPVSTDKNVHYEYKIEKNSIKVALHFEGSHKDRKDVQKLIMAKADGKMPLLEVANASGVGCNYIIEGTDKLDLATDMMAYLIGISWDILKEEKLLEEA